jgi:hypothetical protein
MNEKPHNSTLTSTQTLKALRLDFRSLERFSTHPKRDLLAETIIGIAAILELEYKTPPYQPPTAALDIIAAACNRLDDDTFEQACLWAAKTHASDYVHKMHEAWFETARRIDMRAHELPGHNPPRRIIEVLDETTFEIPPRPSDPPQKEPQLFDAVWYENTPIPKPQPTPSRVIILPQPDRPKKKKPTTKQYSTIAACITDEAPSHLKVYVAGLKHTNNPLSSRGRYIYPYGQEYLAQFLGVSLRTISAAFAWLRRKRIIFKRRNENPDQHKCATWFWCATWKQSAYFFDAQHRRPKGGSPRSRRTRKRTPTHT